MQSITSTYLSPLGGIVKYVVDSCHFGQNCPKRKTVSKHGEKYLQLYIKLNKHNFNNYY